MKQNLLLLFTLCGISYTHAQDNKGLIINEIMQSNVETYMYDDLNEIPDSWVELYNNSDEAVNLKDYMIGTKDKASKAYQLPDMTVEPNKYVIIYCDKEETGLHTSFRLESDKEGNVYLFKGKDIVDQTPKIPVMPAPDVAYGRKTNGSDEWGFLLTPTPEAENCGQICEGDHILGTPVFSVPGRVSTGNETINLELSLPEGAPDGAFITYTTDGSEPTTSSAIYTTPISIKKSGTKEQGYVIRAKVFCNGWLSTKSSAQSYIFHPRNKLPVISILTNQKYLDDKQHGIIECNQVPKVRNDWRRPINLEYFPEVGVDKKSAINQIGEFRVQGGQSRENALKSMAVYANKRFGVNRFKYEFFPDQKPGVKEFKSITLRDGGNDFTDLFFRDAIIQNTMGRNTDLDWMACHTAVIYINGKYKGILNIRERSNDDNIFSNYKGADGKGLEDLDMVEISHEKVNNVDQFLEELKAGEWDNYRAFQEFYSQKGHTKAEYEQWLDVNEYFNVMILNLFYGNIDFPGNNTVFWRPNTEDSPNPTKWRVILKDTDFGLGLYNRSSDFNTIDLLYNPNKYGSDNWAFTEPATRLIKNMLENEDLRQLFIDKCCVYMGDFMNAQGTGAVIDSISNLVIDEFVEHRKLSDRGKSYGGGNRQQLIDKFDNAKKWLAGGRSWFGTNSSRTDYFTNYLSRHWNLGTAIPVTINKGINNKPESVAVNGIKLSKGVFDGKLFPNRMYTVTATAPEGQIVKGWKVTKNNQTSTVEGSEYAFTLDASTSSFAIEALLAEDTGVNAATIYQWKWQRTEGGINVSNVPEGQKVSIYDLRGMLKSEAISNGSDIFLPAAAGQLYILKVGSESVKIQ